MNSANSDISRSAMNCEMASEVARVAGGDTSSPQRELWGYVVDQNQAREASDIIRGLGSRTHFMSPLRGFGSLGWRFTHSSRCGLLICHQLRRLIEACVRIADRLELTVNNVSLPACR
jgi:hypothetical protein